MQGSSDERRRHRRSSVHLPVRVSTIDPEIDAWTGRPVFRASSEISGNLSTGGVFLHATDPLSPGRRVLLEVELPRGMSFEAVGRVAWCRAGLGGSAREAGIGIRFEASAREQVERLETFLGGL